MRTALVLAGHGSHISAHTAGLVWRHVDALRALRVADEITATFWKEMPGYHQVLRTLAADDVTIVPLFTAQGYFTQTVMPSEMQLNGAVTHDGERTIRYVPTLSTHPYLTQIVLRRVESVLQAQHLTASEVAVAVIGHSTVRNASSRQATEAQAQALRAAGIVHEVQAVYLDDTPTIAEIYALTTAPTLIAVPYFLAAGSHTTIDVPCALGLAADATQALIQGRSVFYTPPVGIEDDLLEVILSLARDAGAPFESGASGDAGASGDVWQSFPTVGAELLGQAVRAAGVLKFGGLHLSAQNIHVWDDAEPHERLTTPAALRARLRENPFRSLATSDDLPRGWVVCIENAAQLAAVVETIYPGALAEWALQRTGTLVVSSLQATAARQQGIYRRLGTLTLAQQSSIVQSVCGGCVRHPVWFDGVKPDALPCAEACNHWLSAALEVEE